MKIVQITDLHLTGTDARVYGLDTLARFRACLRDVASNHADADLVVLSGDLSDGGTPESYEVLATELAGSGLPIRLMIGNHDDRANFLRVFPDAACETGHVQSAVDLPEGRVVLLDTLVEGEVPGALCAERLGWLDARLAEAGDRPVYLFTHHPPMCLGLPVLDSVRLFGSDDLHAVLARHGNVRHLFFGHVHRVAAGSWRGVPFTTVRAVAHQFGLDFAPDRLTKTQEAPFYALALIDEESVVVHFHDFTDRSERFP